MIIKRRQHQVPGLNTTSTADISFMLLIFFLVTSSMDTDKGLTRQLPPLDDSTQQELVQMKERNVLRIEIDASDVMRCNGDVVSPRELTARVEEFVANRADDPALPEKSRREVHLLGLTTVSDRHVISVSASPQSTYDAYFQMQDAITRGYNNLRNRLATERFGRTMNQCTQEQRDAIQMVYPQRISEQGVAEKGGEP